jgi:hypothetical protein
MLIENRNMIHGIIPVLGFVLDSSFLSFDNLFCLKLLSFKI